jgi:hypothetical protein
VRHTVSYVSVPAARPLHASTHLLGLRVSPQNPGEVEAALRRPYLQEASAARKELEQ